MCIIDRTTLYHINSSDMIFSSALSVTSTKVLTSIGDHNCIWMVSIYQEKREAHYYIPSLLYFVSLNEILSSYFSCREGVQFMFDCVSGLSINANISGCILADDMGYISFFLIISH